MTRNVKKCDHSLPLVVLLSFLIFAPLTPVYANTTIYSNNRSVPRASVRLVDTTSSLTHNLPHSLTQETSPSPELNWPSNLNVTAKKYYGNLRNVVEEPSEEFLFSEFSVPSDNSLTRKIHERNPTKGRWRGAADQSRNLYSTRNADHFDRASASRC